MKAVDILEESYLAISVNKVRSGLTVLGIVIAIASIIALIAIGQGAKGSIEARIESIGSNLILVMPGFQRAGLGGASQGRGTARSLTVEDVNAIATNITEAAAVAPDLTGRYQVTTRGANTNTQVIGTVADYLVVRNVQLDEGSFLTAKAEQAASRIAVLGPTAVTTSLELPSREELTL